MGDVTVQVTFNANHVDTDTSPLTVDPNPVRIQGQGKILFNLTTQNGNGAQAGFAPFPITFPANSPSLAPFKIPHDVPPSSVELTLPDDNPLGGDDAPVSYQYVLTVNYKSDTFTSPDPVIINEPPTVTPVG